jgi:hypothetical protein
MGFFKNQQVKLAMRLLEKQYAEAGRPLPDNARLKEQAQRLVDDAHRIARERGGNVLAILKAMGSQAFRR